MEFDSFEVCVPNEDSPIGYFMHVWLDYQDGDEPLHTFEPLEPVFLKSDMGVTERPIWWIERFERTSYGDVWNVRVRTDLVLTPETNWKIIQVHNLIPVPAMLRIALEASRP